ncbi:oligosaccharide repeat unit polymerase [Vibrio sp. Isolate33]|uniref:O-antigen polymerase n=1 Tax=Vibrio sp. Isolate33 TaxID=2908539 RepID=UPI001EFEBCC6|nr:O-antigen polymerase [Vibrio sp. Isolate33]MCG9544421.1 oligosaccharide repeat unit polymerase [Vibrio sp. Isolate33]
MFMIFLFLMIFTVIALKSRLNNGGLSLFLVFNITWLFAIFLAQLDLSSFGELSVEIRLYLLCYLLFFNLAYIIFYLSFKDKLNLAFYDKYEFENLKNIAGLTKLSWMIWFSLFLVFIVTIENEIGLFNFLFSGQARASINEINNDAGVLIYYYIFGSLSCCITVYKSCFTKLSKIECIGIVVVLLSLLLTGAKINFITCIIMMFGVKYRLKYTNDIRLIYFGIIAVVLFYLFIILFSVFTGKAIDNDVGSLDSLNDLSSLTINVLLYPYDYAIGALYALDEKLFTHNSVIVEPYLPTILNKFYLIVNKVLGFEYISVNSSVLDFIEVGEVVTNVYTMHLAIINELSLLGAFLSSIVLGFVLSAVDYFSKMKRNFTVTFLYASFLPVCVLSLVAYKFNDTILYLSFLLLVCALFKRIALLYVKQINME